MTITACTAHGTFRVAEYPHDARSVLTFVPIDGPDGETVLPSGVRYRVRVNLTLSEGAYRPLPGEEFNYVQRRQSNDVWVFRQKWRSRATLEWLVANVVAELTQWARSHHSEVASVIQSGIRSTRATARNYGSVIDQAEAGPACEARVRRAATFRARQAAEESLLSDYTRFLHSARA